MTTTVGSARSFGSVGRARLLWIELRRNTMIWMLPMLAVAFWFDC